MTGTVRAHERGFAFITPDSGGEDYFVPAHATNGAFHGDKVIFAHVKGTADEAVILSVTERNPSPVVGTLVFERNSARVYPDDEKRPTPSVPRSCLYGAKNGQKVVCEITSFPKGRAPVGKIVEIIGEEGDLAAEELSIIRAYGLETNFSDETVKEAQKAEKTYPVPTDRTDLKDKIIFTVDGDDTRDMDDAVSIEKSGDRYILGVHIADVSHYVKYGSAPDREAYERGTSVYFPDRVLPMLPKEYSNGICSLNEGEDRYAVTCEMTFDKSGKRLDRKIFESVIRSRHKTTYREVAAVCEGDPSVRLKYSDIADSIDAMKELCLILERRRKSMGCIDMDLPDAHIYVNEDGEIEIPRAERTISERMIEQFMIAANETVAEFMREKDLPCLYRVHEKPSPEKTAEFFSFIRNLGIKTEGGFKDTEPRDFKNILEKVADKPYGKVVNKVMLRSMQKARYCSDNLKHFGLASECYCHFTSPIRRYPDLFVHRSLKCFLHKNAEKAAELFREFAKKAGAELSEREITAERAERDVDDLYKLAYMSDKLGEEFDAIVSGVTAHGGYCELENTVEGLIPYEDLPDDGYEFFADKFMLKGRTHSFRMGDSLRIRIIACDLGKMKVIMKVCL